MDITPLVVGARVVVRRRKNGPREGFVICIRESRETAKRLRLAEPCVVVDVRHTDGRVLTYLEKNVRGGACGA